jgi:hypothetical protein
MSSTAPPPASVQGVPSYRSRYGKARAPPVRLDDEAMARLATAGIIDDLARFAVRSTTTMTTTTTTMAQATSPLSITISMGGGPVPPPLRRPPGGARECDVADETGGKFGDDCNHIVRDERDGDDDAMAEKDAIAPKKGRGPSRFRKRRRSVIDPDDNGMWSERDGGNVRDATPFSDDRANQRPVAEREHPARGHDDHRRKRPRTGRGRRPTPTPSGDSDPDALQRASRHDHHRDGGRDGSVSGRTARGTNVACASGVDRRPADGTTRGAEGTRGTDEIEEEREEGTQVGGPVREGNDDDDDGDDEELSVGFSTRRMPVTPNFIRCTPDGRLACAADVIHTILGWCDPCVYRPINGQIVSRLRYGGWSFEKIAVATPAPYVMGVRTRHVPRMASDVARLPFVRDEEPDAERFCGSIAWARFAARLAGLPGLIEQGRHRPPSDAVVLYVRVPPMARCDGLRAPPVSAPQRPDPARAISRPLSHALSTLRAGTDRDPLLPSLFTASPPAATAPSSSDAPDARSAPYASLAVDPDDGLPDRESPLIKEERFDDDAWIAPSAPMQADVRIGGRSPFSPHDGPEADGHADLLREDRGQAKEGVKHHDDDEAARPRLVGAPIAVGRGPALPATQTERATAEAAAAASTVDREDEDEKEEEAMPCPPRVRSADPQAGTERDNWTQAEALHDATVTQWIMDRCTGDQPLCVWTTTDGVWNLVFALQPPERDRRCPWKVIEGANATAVWIDADRARKVVSHALSLPAVWVSASAPARGPPTPFDPCPVVTVADRWLMGAARNLVAIRDAVALHRRRPQGRGPGESAGVATAPSAYERSIDAIARDETARRMTRAVEVRMRAMAAVAASTPFARECARLAAGLADFCAFFDPEPATTAAASPTAS